MLVSTPELVMQSYYAARANEYDRVYDKPERQADVHAMQEWLPSLFVGSRLLEVACGTGFWTQFIAPLAEQVVALDYAPEVMLLRNRAVPQIKSPSLSVTHTIIAS